MFYFIFLGFASNLTLSGENKGWRVLLNGKISFKRDKS